LLVHVRNAYLLILGKKSLLEVNAARLGEDVEELVTYCQQV
jgi:hypothetical protein